MKTLIEQFNKERYISKGELYLKEFINLIKLEFDIELNRSIKVLARIVENNYITPEHRNMASMLINAKEREEKRLFVNKLLEDMDELKQENRRLRNRTRNCDCGEILSQYCPKCLKNWES